MSDEKNYGRKIIRDKQKVVRRRNRYARRFFLFMAGCLTAGAVIGGLVTGLVVHGSDVKHTAISEKEAEVIYGSDADVRPAAKEDAFYWKRNDEKFVPLNVDMDEDTQKFVYALSSAYHIDWTLPMAVIGAESEFKADTVSSTNDYGLMQINKSNHSWLTADLGVTDFLDAKQNIRSGLYILHGLYEKYGNDTNKVLIAYNMGEGNAEELFSGGVKSTPYSQKVTALQKEYKNQLKGENNNE